MTNLEPRAISRVAKLDPKLSATIVSRVPLRYREGADRTTDRPAHVRAGSSLAWFGNALALVQDDANFIALVDPATGLADAITLPAGKLGLRQFDDARGNKRFKLDLEACCVVDNGGEARLLVFGSGSDPLRRRIAMVDANDSTSRVSMVDADVLYRTLGDAVEFAGGDMNIEGAVALPPMLRLFSRGNGAARDGRAPLNATCDLKLATLIAYLDAPRSALPPAAQSIVQYELGAIDGLPLGFTDATPYADALLYTAAAEGSAMATVDGPVAGSVIGVIAADGSVRYAPLIDADGRPAREKIEGISPVPNSSDHVYVVVDSDDATRPSELCTVKISGYC